MMRKIFDAYVRGDVKEGDEVKAMKKKLVASLELASSKSTAGKAAAKKAASSSSTAEKAEGTSGESAGVSRFTSHT